jgi:hypothetical protein
LRLAGFVLAGLSLVLSLTVSANLLYVLGIDYAHPGGNPLVKIHPATWAIAGALLLLVLPDPVGRLRSAMRRDPSLAWFMVLMTMTMIYSAVSVGVSGATVYVESYLAAGVLALVCRELPEWQRRLLGLLVLGLVVGNAALAVAETVGQFHLVPVYLEETALVDEPGAFRSSALFDHPLTGAMLTMVGLFAALSFRLRAVLLVPILGLFGVALLAFGGRAALGVTVLGVLLVTARWVLGDLFGRRLQAGRMALLAAMSVLLPIACAVLVMCTGIGGRVAGKLYLDSSAQSRGAEWLVLGLLDLRAWLFGSPIANTPELIYRIGLQSALTDIENFWLMAFVNLGIVGFVGFVCALCCLMRHLWRVASPWGRVAIVALMVTASTSNSLGRKCNVLMILVACVEAGGAFGREKPRIRENAAGVRLTPVRRASGFSAAASPSRQGFSVVRPVHG